MQHLQKTGGGDLLWLTSPRLLSTIRRSNVRTRRRFGSHFLPSCLSLSKECLRTLLKSEASALFLKTAGCMGSFPFRNPSPATCFGLSLVTSHGSPVTSPATLFHPWLPNASANIFSPISTGAKRSRAPSAFHRTPPCRSRTTINIAGSKSAPATLH